MEAYNSHFKIIENLTRTMGLWPSQSKFMKRLLTHIVWFSVLSFLLQELLALKNNWGNLDFFITLLPPCFVNLLGICCLTGVSANRNKIELIFAKIKEDYMHYESDLEYEILQEYGLVAKNAYIIEVLIFYIVGVEYVFLPLIPFFLDIVMPLNESRPRSLIMLAEYFVDSDNDYNYLAISVHQVPMVFLLATVIVAIDGIFIVFIYHACGQFEILGFVNEVSECFSMPYFFGLGLNMLMISFTGVQLIINLDNQSETVKLLIYSSGQIVRLFCLALPSQRLIDQSTLLFQCIYESYWYTLSPKSKGMLRMLMLMCIRPVKFTAGKLYSFSMSSFSAVMRTSVSYFTVLMSVR